MTVRQKTADLARGKWPDILSVLGVDARLLSKKNCPCPRCGGKDRFRFTDHNGDGVWVCEPCGGGDGFGLLEAVHGWDFKTACREIDAIVCNIDESAAPTVMSEKERMGKVEALWMQGVPVVSGDPVHRYLASRGVGFLKSFPDIRCVDKIHFAGRDLTMMAALLRDNRGHPVNLHRTFIEDGRKADIESPRMMMAGTMPDVPCAVRLGPIQDHIGIAEGMETAAAAAKIFGLPVWSALNTGIMAKWVPPKGVKKLTIFADNDVNFAGFKTAYTLAYRLSTHRDINVDVDVKHPDKVGNDFADELEKSMKSADRKERVV